MGVIENTLIAEEFCKKDSTIGAAIMLSTFAAEYLLRFGSDRQRAFLSDVIEGRILSGAAFFGAESASDPAENAPAAERTDNGWRLSGAVDYVINGGKAGIYCILCSSGGDQGRMTEAECVKSDVECGE